MSDERAKRIEEALRRVVAIWPRGLGVADAFLMMAEDALALEPAPPRVCEHGKPLRGIVCKCADELPAPPPAPSEECP